MVMSSLNFDEDVDPDEEPNWDDDMPEPVPLVKLYWQDVWYAMKRRGIENITKEKVIEFMECFAEDVSDCLYENVENNQEAIDAVLEYSWHRKHPED